MKSPFPGMDPFLELRWRDVHSSLVIYARDAVNRQLPAGLLARSEERTLVSIDDESLRDISPDVSIYEQFPDAEMPWRVSNDGGLAVMEMVKYRIEPADFRQRFIEIRDARSGGKVITVIEFVSPTNKRLGDGLEKYHQKQRECRAAGVNLVEIDLTRAGDRSLIFPMTRIKPFDRSTYLATIFRAADHYSAWVGRLPLDRRLDAIPIPLRLTDPDILLDLQPLIDQVYENGRYREEIDYNEKLEPPLSATDAAWMATLLQKHAVALT